MIISTERKKGIKERKERKEKEEGTIGVPERREVEVLFKGGKALLKKREIIVN